TYFHPEEEQAGTVNIGWLDLRYPFPTGETSDEFRAKLSVISLWRVKQTRGFQPCYFCTGRDRPAGSAGIRGAGGEGGCAAPILVHHYVAAHWYRPPEEFIAAVLAWDPSEAPDPERAALELALALQPTNPAHAWRLWKRLHGRCGAVVRRLFRPAALTSLAGAAAFANAYHELLEISLE